MRIREEELAVAVFGSEFPPAKIVVGDVGGPDDTLGMGEVNESFGGRIEVGTKAVCIHGLGGLFAEYLGHGSRVGGGAHVENELLVIEVGGEFTGKAAVFALEDHVADFKTVAAQAQRSVGFFQRDASIAAGHGGDVGVVGEGFGINEITTDIGSDVGRLVKGAGGKPALHDRRHQRQKGGRVERAVELVGKVAALDVVLAVSGQLAIAHHDTGVGDSDFRPAILEG